MSINKSDRKESSVEFDATYFKVYHDAVNLIENSFGAKGSQAERKGYIGHMSSAIMKSVTELVYNLFNDKEVIECLKKTTLSY